MQSRRVVLRWAAVAGEASKFVVDDLPAHGGDVRFQAEAAGGDFDLLVVASAGDRLGSDLDEVAASDVGTLERAQLISVTGDGLQQQRADVRFAFACRGGAQAVGRLDFGVLVGGLAVDLSSDRAQLDVDGRR